VRTASIIRDEFSVHVVKFNLFCSVIFRVIYLTSNTLKTNYEELTATVQKYLQNILMNHRGDGVRERQTKEGRKFKIYIDQ
jgi:hypothetical protein